MKREWHNLNFDETIIHPKTKKTQILKAINLIHDQIERKKIRKGTLEFQVAMKVITKLTNHIQFNTYYH